MNRVAAVPTLDTLPPPPPGATGWPWTEVYEEAVPGSAEGARPRLSIVTPSYNQGRFLERTIRSVLLQGYENLEYIAIDGGSTDASVDILRKYEPWLTYWTSESDDGQAAAINAGLTRATGTIVGWLNSDDFYLPGAIDRILRLHRRHPDAAGWVGGCYRVDGRGRILSTVLPRNLDHESLGDWSYRGFFYQPACLMSARAFRAAGPLREDLHYAFDLDLWLRLTTIGRLRSTSSVIAAALIHREAKTQGQRAAMHAENCAVQFAHDFHGPAVRRMAEVLGKKPGARTLGKLQEYLGWFKSGRPTLDP